MADTPQATISGINWREALPFTHVFRAFRLAIHPSKLMLALVGLLMVYFGGRVMDAVWPVAHTAVPDEILLYQDAVRGASTPSDATRQLGRRLGEMLNALGREGANDRMVSPASSDFKHARAMQRSALERHYAMRLGMLNHPELKTEEQVLAAARAGKYLGAVKDQILAQRELAVAAANKAFASISSPTAEQTRAHEQAVRRIYADASEGYALVKQIKGGGLFIAFFEYQAGQIYNVIGGVTALSPTRVISSIINFFTVGPAWAFTQHPVYFSIFTLWFLLIWSIFGGALARIAAVHAAKDEKLSIRQALRFSVAKFLSFFFAPIIPLLIVLAVGLLVTAAALLGNIPVVGPIVIGLFFFLALIAGFVMTLVLLGTLGGFNLMYPTIAVEGSDSFDAISRSFSYLYARPWRLAFYTMVAVVYGALTYLFVRLFLYVMLASIHYFVGLGMFVHADNNAPLWSMLWEGPTASGRLIYNIDFLALGPAQDTAAVLVAIWVFLTISMLGAFAISFYFCANTLIYYLMRREVDATELDDVYLDQTDEEFGEMTPPATEPAPATTDASATLLPVVQPTASMPAAPPATDVTPTPQSTSAPDVTPATPSNSAMESTASPADTTPAADTPPSSDMPSSSDMRPSSESEPPSSSQSQPQDKPPIP